MPETTLICLWWLNRQNFKIITESLSLKLKIGVLKILVLMAVKLKNTERILKISPHELSLDSEVILDSLKWLSKLNIIVIVNSVDLGERKEYLIEYIYNEQMLSVFYHDCWVELPNHKVLNFLKKTPNDKYVTYESLFNYLMLIKGLKKNTDKTKQIYFDEDFLNGHYKGTWREVLLKYKLIEFFNFN